MFQKIIRSKTMWLATLLSVLGVVQASMDVFTPYLSAQAMGIVTLIIGVLVAILRAVTTQPLSDK